MDRNLIPKNVYLRKMKEDLDHKSMEKHIEEIKNELLDKWSEVESNFGLHPIFLFEEDYNSISAYAIEFHKEYLIEIEFEGEQNELKFSKQEASFHIRKPMAFFDFEIEVKRLANVKHSIIYSDSKEDKEVINSLKDGFNQLENMHIVGRQLISRGIIINSIKTFCQNRKIASIEFRTTRKRIHFVDSTNGIVYKGIRNCLEEIFGIDKDEIEIVIENKVSNQQ